MFLKCNTYDKGTRVFDSCFVVDTYNSFNWRDAVILKYAELDRNIVVNLSLYYYWLSQTNSSFKAPVIIYRIESDLFSLRKEIRSYQWIKPLVQRLTLKLINGNVSSTMLNHIDKMKISWKNK